jgi:hypothetical protein
MELHADPFASPGKPFSAVPGLQELGRIERCAALRCEESRATQFSSSSQAGGGRNDPRPRWRLGPAPASGHAGWHPLATQSPFFRRRSGCANPLRHSIIALGGRARGPITSLTKCMSGPQSSCPPGRQHPLVPTAERRRQPYCTSVSLGVVTAHERGVDKGIWYRWCGVIHTTSLRLELLQVWYHLVSPRLASRPSQDLMRGFVLCV